LIERALERELAARGSRARSVDVIPCPAERGREFIGRPVKHADGAWVP
jgi:hypothetical protein